MPIRLARHAAANSNANVIVNVNVIVIVIGFLSVHRHIRVSIATTRSSIALQSIAEPRAMPKNRSLSSRCCRHPLRC